MSITHKEALDKFIAHLSEQGRSPSTIVAYKKDIEQLFGHFAPKHNTMGDYNTSHLQIYIEKLIEEKTFTLKTISRKINSYKTLFKFLYKNNHIQADVAHPISHPKFEAKEPRILSSLEYKALRDTARSNPRLYTMVELLLQTGIRIGELSRIRMNDLNLDNTASTLRITEFASNPERTITLNKDCIDALRNYIAVRPKPLSEEEYLFITKSKKQVLVRNIRTMVNNTFKKAGVKDVTVNDIRNTFIVYQLEHGMPLEKVAEIVGHQRLTSTEKYLQIIKSKKTTGTSKIIAL